MANLTSFMYKDYRKSKKDRVDILFITDAPNVKACEHKLPIPPDNLKLFGKIANEAGLVPDNTFFVTCTPHMDDDTYNRDKVKTEFIKSHKPKLHKYIELLNPRVIVPMGNNALNSISTQKMKITSNRGKFTEMDVNGKTYTVLPTLSIAQVARDPNHELSILRDFERLVHYKNSNYTEQTASGTKEARSYRYVDDIEFLLKLKPNFITFDTETTGLDHFRDEVYPFLLQISYQDNESLLIPIHPDWKSEELPRDHDKLFAQAKQLLEDKSITKVAHNIKFDYLMLKKIGINVAGQLDDTMLMVRMIDENISDKSLNNSVTLFLPEYSGFNDELEATIDKSNMWNVPLDKMKEYAGNDTCILYKLYNELLPRLEADTNHYRIYREVIMPAIINAADTLETEGINIDVSKLGELGDELTGIVAAQKQKTIDLIPKKAISSWAEKGKQPNLGSSQFLSHVLFTKYGFNLKPLEYTKSTAKLSDRSLRVPSTGQAHLKEFRDRCDFVSELLEYKKLVKMKTTYVGDISEGTGLTQFLYDGRIRPSYTLHKSVTMRWTSERPNGQNLPKRGAAAKALRSVMVSRPGYVLVQNDYSQCVLEGTFVTTSEGHKKVEHINVGDLVKTHTGRYMPVTATLASIKSVVDIRLNDGGSLHLSEEHPVYVVRNGEYTWVKVKELAVGDTIVKNDNTSVELPKPDDTAYMYGYFLGNGHYSKTSNTVVMSCGDKACELTDLFDSLLGKQGKDYSKKGDVVYQAKHIKRMFEENCPKSWSHSAEVSPALLEASPEARYGVLSGLCDSDGSYHSRRFTYASMSSTLIRQFKLIAESFGIYGVTRRDPRTLCWLFDVFDVECLKRLPEPRVSFKRAARIAMLDKTPTHCRTTKIPYMLISKFDCLKGKANTPASNNLWSNAKTRGYTTRHAITLASAENPVNLPLTGCLKYRYVEVTEISRPGVTASFHDLEVAEDHSFEAEGYLVHNCELRVMAWISKVKNMITAYSKGYDLHEVTAAGNLAKSSTAKTSPKSLDVDGLVEWFRGFKITDKELYDLKRFQAKGSNFSLIYKVAVAGFRSYCRTAFERFDMTMETAQDEFDAFYKTYPELLRYFRAVEKFLLEKKYIKNICGLRRHLPEVDVSSQRSRAIRQAINFTDQSLGAIISTMAFNDVCSYRNLLPDPTEFYVCGFIHDALIFEIREDKLDTHLPRLKQLMENVKLKEVFGVESPVAFPVDTEVGTSLANLKEYEVKI